MMSSCVFFEAAPAGLQAVLIGPRLNNAHFANSVRPAQDVPGESEAARRRPAGDRGAAD
jgi:hypothetical protein